MKRNASIHIILLLTQLDLSFFEVKQIMSVLVEKYEEDRAKTIFGNYSSPRMSALSSVFIIFLFLFTPFYHLSLATHAYRRLQKECQSPIPTSATVLTLLFAW